MPVLLIFIINKIVIENIYVMLVIIPTLIIHTSTGIMINSYTSFKTNHDYMPDYIINIMHLSITIIIIYVMNYLYYINFSYLYLINIILLSIYTVNYIRPLIYYIFSLLINIYIYSLGSILLFITFIIIMISFNIMSASLTLNFIHNINYIMIIFLITLVVYKTSNFYIEKNIK